MISVEAVTIEFANGFVVARAFSAEAPEGSVTALVGPSGCGKTSLLRAIRGTLPISSGTIAINGKAAVEGRRDVFHSPQAAILLGYRTVLANAVFPSELTGSLSSERVDLAREVLGRLGLRDALRQTGDKLSGGMAKRVGLAQALVSDARCLLLDEPFASLDVVNRRAAEEVLTESVNRNGQTCLLAAHDLDSVAAVAERALVLSGPPWFQVIDVPIAETFDGTRQASSRREHGAFSSVVARLQTAVTNVSNLRQEAP